MERRDWLACVALLFAGCAQPNGPAVSPGAEMEVYDAKDSEVIGWRDAEHMGRTRHELITIPVGTKVRWIDGNRMVAETPHDMVRIIEGPDRDVTAYLFRSNLRPARPR